MEKVRKNLNFRRRPKWTRSVGYGPYLYKEHPEGRKGEKIFIERGPFSGKPTSTRIGVAPRQLPIIESSGLNLYEVRVLGATAPRHFPLPDCCFGRIVWASSQR